MTTTPSDSMSHLADDELIRLLDGEAIQGEGRGGGSGGDAAQHAATCIRCRTELDRLRADAALIGSWLDRAAFEAGAAVSPVQPPYGARPLRRRARIDPWLRAAAILVLIAGPVAALPALRGWLSSLNGEASHEAPAVLHELTRAAAPSVVRFVPSSSVLTVTLEAGQVDGSISVRYGTGSEVVFEVTADAESAPVIGESGMRIRNSTGDAADYVITVPSAVERVIVRIGTAAPVAIDAAALRSGFVMPVVSR